jgi:hypothetical protein
MRKIRDTKVGVNVWHIQTLCDLNKLIFFLAPFNSRGRTGYAELLLVGGAMVVEIVQNRQELRKIWGFGSRDVFLQKHVMIWTCFVIFHFLCFWSSKKLCTLNPYVDICQPKNNLV